MTLQDRAAVFNQAFARFPASHLHIVTEKGGPVLYGTWLIGNSYRTASTLYGAYPKGYLERVMALFPDVAASRRTLDLPLHVFSGSLPKGDYLRLDVNPERSADYHGSVYDVAEIFAPFVEDGGFALVLADPPYSPQDAEKYSTPMVDRRRATAALAQVTRVGGHLVWLDCVWPQFRKADWRTVGRITLIRSTNHRIRLVSIFERQEP